MAHIKSGGTTKGNRDSQSKRLGIKIYGDQKAKIGSIIVRQKGTRFHPGRGVGMGKDHTLYAKTAGNVIFSEKYDKRIVSVEV